MDKDKQMPEDLNLKKIENEEGASELHIYDPEAQPQEKIDAVDQTSLAEAPIPEDLKDNPEIIKADKEAEEKLAQLKEETRAKLTKLIAIVGVDSKARDTAMDRSSYEMTEEARKLKWVSGFFKKLWKHGLARDAYHFDKQRLAHKKIMEENNIFANETEDDGREISQEIKAQKHQEFARATTERFLSENNDLVEEAIGERKVEANNLDIKDEIKNLIVDFARGGIDEAAFLEEKNRIISQVRNTNEAILGKLQVDNILEVAKEVKDLAEHQAGLEGIEFDINLTLGKAEGGIKKQGNYSKLESIVKKISSHPLGAAVLNETSIAASVIAASALAINTGSKMAASWGGRLLTFGLGIGIASGFAYKKEAMRTEHDRESHERELASKGGQLKDLMEAAPEAPTKPESFSSEAELKEFKAKEKAYKKDKRRWERDYGRRLELEKARYESVKAEDLIKKLQANYNDNGQLKDLDRSGFEQALGGLSDAIARNNLANERRIDLISYSAISQVESERTELLKTISRLKVDLKRFLETKEGENLEPDDTEEIADLRFEISQLEKTLETTRDQEVFRNLEEQIQQKKLELERLIAINRANTKLPQATELKDLIDLGASAQAQELQKDITEKDKLFRKIKSARAWKAAKWTAIIGTTLGLAAQEIGAALSDKMQGIFEHIKAPGINNQFTALEALRRFMEGNFEAANLPMHEVPLGHNILQLPEGVDLAPGKNGLFDLISHGQKIAEGLSLESDGTLTDSAKSILEQAGIATNETAENIIREGTTTADAHGLLDNFQKNGANVEGIKRLLWFDNNTPAPKFDFNELKEFLHLNGNGDYAFDIKSMAPEGSFHGADAANAQALMAEGKMNILLSLSRETQNEIIKIPVGPDGLAIIDKGSEIGQKLFAIVNGEPTSLAKYAEVAYEAGVSPDGKSLQKILATVVGQGVEGGEIKTEVVDTIYKTSLNGSNTWAMSYFIPVNIRRPLEKLRNLFTKKNKEEQPNRNELGPEPEIQRENIDGLDQEIPVAATLSPEQEEERLQQLERTLETTRDPKVFRSIEDQIIAGRAAQKAEKAESLEPSTPEKRENANDNKDKIKQIQEDYQKYYNELKEREEEIKRVIWDKEKVASFEKAKAHIEGKMKELLAREANIIDAEQLKNLNDEEAKWQQELEQESELAVRSGLDKGEKFQRNRDKILKKIDDLKIQQDPIKSRMIDRTESEDSFFETLDLMGPIQNGSNTNYDTNYFRNLLNNPDTINLNQIPNKYNLPNKFKKLRMKKGPSWKILS
ncbi:MAG: hypothetical protein WC441_02170 [Patescibacteria group bacterium]